VVIPKNSDSPYGDFSFWGGSDKVAISLARRSPKRRCVTPIQSPPNSPVIRFENKNTAVYSHDHDPNQILSELERILKPPQAHQNGSNIAIAKCDAFCSPILPPWGRVDRRGQRV
jgi:hypothetical protein